MKNRLVWLAIILISNSLYGLSEKKRKVGIYTLATLTAVAATYAGYHIIKAYMAQEDINPLKRKKYYLHNVEQIMLSNNIIIYQSNALPAHTNNCKYSFRDIPKDRKETTFITKAEYGKVTVSIDGDTTTYPLSEGEDGVLILSESPSFANHAPWKWNSCRTENGKYKNVFDSLLVRADEKKTSLEDGIQPHEILEIYRLDLDESKKLDTLILTMGFKNTVRTDARTENLKSYFMGEEFKSIFPRVSTIYILPTVDAIDLYNDLILKEENMVGIILHIW